MKFTPDTLPKAQPPARVWGSGIPIDLATTGITVSETPVFEARLGDAAKRAKLKL